MVLNAAVTVAAGCVTEAFRGVLGLTLVTASLFTFLYFRLITSKFPLEYAIMKCLNLIGQCEGSKSLRATVHGLYM